MINREFVLTQPRKRVLRHKWDDKQGSRLLQHKVCPVCKCEKFFSMETYRTVYMDRFGHTTYRAPNCELPNTKI